MSEFVQQAPRRTNRWRTDAALRRAAGALLPAEVLEEAGPLLDEAGTLAAGEWPRLADRAEANPPVHVPYDPWGRRVDRIDVDPAWERLVAEGQRLGLVSIPHERPWGDHSRVVQSVFLQLYSPVTATAACPLGMSDGAAVALRRHDGELAARYVPRLLAREGGWTSGQWMTEKEGGSDVSRTSTTAVPGRGGEAGTWRLYGTKWFTSATTTDMALVLARPEGAGAGSRALSLFALELRHGDGSWNGIVVRRLKDKLGTRGLPTAELDLDGALATPVGGLGRGVAKVTSMLAAARLLSAASAVSAAGDLLDLARGYARVREVFGRPLARQPIHVEWLADLAATYEAGLLLVLHAAREAGAADAGETELARLAPTIAKFAVTRQAVDACSQLLESFGGMGYLEDTGIPRQLRDTQVQTIWEGTSSALAHDTVRALERDAGLGRAWQEEVSRLTAVHHDVLTAQAGTVRMAAASVDALLKEPDAAAARRLAWAVARTWQAALLVHHADLALASGDRLPAAVATQFLRHPLVPADAGLSAADRSAVALGRPSPDDEGAPPDG